MIRYLSAIALATATFVGSSTAFAADVAPLKILLITGGCCHDYAQQKDILKNGIQARAHCVVEQMHSDDTTVKPPLAIYGNPDYAKGFDLVIHDECAAGVSDPAVIAGVLKPHQDGVPGVNLHCAMHSYRSGDFKKSVTPGADNATWFEYLGLQTTSHGPQLPIAITFVDKEHPIVKGMADWTTINEELYNNINVLTSHALALGKQGTKENDAGNVVIWTNEYGAKKTRVFSTTIGHNNGTVEDPRYLDLVTRGVLWATGHLNADGTAATGYGKK